MPGNRTAPQPSVFSCINFTLLSKILTEVLKLKKTVNQENFKRILYSVTALVLCFVALFSFWMSNKDNDGVLPDVTDSVSTTKNAPREDIQVNTPVTNVPDDRYDNITTTTEAVQDIFYSFPLGNSVSKEYSKDELVKNATTGDWRTHNGVDIKGKKGESVKAISDGTVTHLSHNALWGTTITIDHGNGIVAKYCGFEKDSTVKPGDDVKANQQIGTLGEIPLENADGIHLHLEITKDGVSVSPSDYLGKHVDIKR